MPKTCRTDTFMSGKPEISRALVVAAVVIIPPRSRAFPKPDIYKHGRRWGRLASLAESANRQKPAGKSKFHCFFMQISMKRRFGKAALRITDRIFQAERGRKSAGRFAWHFLRL